MMVKEIHAKVDSSIEYLLERIETNSIKDYLGTFTEKQFSGLVGEYRLKYPQNPFITEKQVKDICLEYDLKFGSMLSFVDEIPIKNELEIKWYNGPGHNIFDIDYFKGKMNMRHIMDEMMSGRTRMNIQMEHGYRGNDDIKLMLRGSLRNFMPHKFMIPLTKDMAIHMDYRKIETIEEDVEISNGCSLMSLGKRSYQHGGLSFVLQDHEYNMILIPIPNDLVTVMQSAQREHLMFGNGRIQIGIQCEMMINHIMDIAQHEILNRNYKTSMKVIAPGEFFNTTSLKEVDGYRFSLDELAMEGSFAFMDDPIVLDPVDGGYLVVSKWGGESDLIDTNSN